MFALIHVPPLWTWIVSFAFFFNRCILDKNSIGCWLRFFREISHAHKILATFLLPKISIGKKERQQPPHTTRTSQALAITVIIIMRDNVWFLITLCWYFVSFSERSKHHSHTHTLITIVIHRIFPAFPHIHAHTQTPYTQWVAYICARR